MVAALNLSLLWASCYLLFNEIVSTLLLSSTCQTHDEFNTQTQFANKLYERLRGAIFPTESPFGTERVTLETNQPKSMTFPKI